MPFANPQYAEGRFEEKVGNQSKDYHSMNSRVANVVVDQDSLITQWRPIKMSKFRANIFLIETTSNYFWASEVSKNQVFKSQFFSSSHASNQWIMKIW